MGLIRFRKGIPEKYRTRSRQLQVVREIILHQLMAASAPVPVCATANHTAWEAHQPKDGTEASHSDSTYTTQYKQ